MLHYLVSLTLSIAGGDGKLLDLQLSTLAKAYTLTPCIFKALRNL